MAEELGFLYVDDEIVARAAAAGGIDPADVADEERRKSLAARLLEGSRKAARHGRSGTEIASGERAEPQSEQVRALITETIAQTVARGDVVIVAHGASHLVAAEPRALRVLVTASPATRAARIGEGESLDPARAARAVKDSDAGRRDYLRRFYDIDEELPTHYDLVVNTDVLPSNRAARIVAQAAG